MNMPPPVATTLLTLGLSSSFFSDIRERPNITGALWIPLIRFLIICSRQVSEWLNIFGLHLGAITLEEGSPLDRCVYFALIAARLNVLGKRQAQLLEIIRNNQ